MARSKKRRESHRCSIVGEGAARRAEIVIALDQLEVPDEDDRRGGTPPPPPIATVARMLPRLREFGHDSLASARSGVSLVIDPFVFRLYLGDVAESVGTHDGDEFRQLAVLHGVELYLTVDMPPRRASPDDLRAAAADGRLLGAHVDAFAVDIA